MGMLTGHTRIYTWTILILWIVEFRALWNLWRSIFQMDVLPMCSQLTMAWVTKVRACVVSRDLLQGLFHKGWFTLGSEDQRNSKIKRSYWLRAKFWIQGVNTRVQDQGMTNWSGTNGALIPAKYQRSPFLKIHLVWETSSQAWVQSWVWETKIHSGVFWMPSIGPGL